MPLNKFVPLSPDPYITSDPEMTLAKFGHLNTIVDYLNAYVVVDSLQLAGSGPITATARYISDSTGVNSAISISTIGVGIGTTAPLTPLDIIGNTNLTGILSVGNYVNATGFGQKIRVIGQGDASIGIYRNQESTFSAKLEFMKSRGTYDVPLIVNSSDILGNIGFFGYNGTSYSSAASIQSVALSTSTGVEGDLRFTVFNNTGGNVNTMRATKDGVGIGNALDYLPSARLQVRGSGSTSATTSLLVQNSSSTQLLKVTDDGSIEMGSASYPFGNALLSLTSSAGSMNFRVGGGNTLYASAGFSASSLASSDVIQGVRVLVGNGVARLTATTTDWLSITDSAQTTNGSGNLSAKFGTFGTTYATINASAQVEIASTTKGFLKPRLTTAQKNAIVTPTAGLEVYDTDLNRPCFYNGSAWVTL